MTVVLFVEPDLTRVRVLRGDVDEQLPLAAAPGAEPEDEAQAARRRASDAAGWLAERSGARVDVLCVGAAETVCDWFAAPSPDPAVLAAAAARRETQWDDASPAVSTIQALADPHHRAATTGRLLARLRGGHDEEAGGLARSQFSVLHTRDGAVRLLLDELDRRGVAVRRTVALWHAQAVAWASPDGASKKTSAPTDSGGRAPVPLTAVVLEEPSGRLSWSWSEEHELLAGGAIGAAPSNTEDASARNGIPAEALAGRLSLEWLAWTTHLQRTPDRIRLVGPNAEALEAQLRDLLPDAEMTATPSPDPIGATLARLAGRQSADRRTDAGGRECLVDLTNRPGRAHRRFGVWVAAAMVVLAAGVAGVGFRAQRLAHGLSAESSAIRDQLRETIAGVAPALADHPDPVGALASRRAEVAEEYAPIEEPPPPKPILAELDRLATVLAANVAEEPGAYLMLAQIDEISASVQVQVPDFATGETLLEQLNQTDGELRWSSTFPTPPPTRQRLSGQWTEGSQ